jgi:uncharacterized lipoprotein NlpE involved in copper resistance
MKKSIFFCFMLITVSFVAMLSGCHSKNPPDIHNARISMSWAGDYYGLLPDEVYGNALINAQITLYSDLTFVLRYHYLGKPDYLFTDKGTFDWDGTGGIIKLNFGYVDFPPYYKVGEKLLIMLEMDGKTISGKLGDNYVLRKPL